MLRKQRPPHPPCATAVASGTLSPGGRGRLSKKKYSPLAPWERAIIKKRNTLPSPLGEGTGVRGSLLRCIIWVIRLKEILLGGGSFTASRFTRHVSRFSAVFAFRALNISLRISSNETLSSPSQTSVYGSDLGRGRRLAHT